jgi:hypothetical protein
LAFPLSYIAERNAEFAFIWKKKAAEYGDIARFTIGICGPVVWFPLCVRKVAGSSTAGCQIFRFLGIARTRTAEKS